MGSQWSQEAMPPPAGSFFFSFLRRSPSFDKSSCSGPSPIHCHHSTSDHQSYKPFVTLFYLLSLQTMRSGQVCETFNDVG